MSASSPTSAGREGAADEPSPGLCISALADGDRESLSRATKLWREDARARESWHLYHLIGDVLRSDDLASRPGQDAAFLTKLRARLASEPVPLAPAAPAKPLVRRLGWRAPAAVAAGFVAVAATVALMRPQVIDGSEQIAGSGAAGGGTVAGAGVRVVSNPLPSASADLVIDGRMIRDARLDAYLRAHQAARGSSSAALPGGALRSVEMLATPEPAPALTVRPPAASEPR